MATSETEAGVDVVSERSRKEAELRYRISVDDSGTKATLATIAAVRAGEAIDGGSLVFSTDAVGGELTRRVVIDHQGSVGIGLLDPKARLHVDGDTLFNGPLTVSGALSGQSLSITGSAEIRDALVVGGDVTVTGKVKASSFAGDGAELTNIGPKSDSIGSAQLANDPESLGKLSGGKIVVKNDSIALTGALSASGSVSAASLNLSGEIHAAGRAIVAGGGALRSTFGRRRGGGPLARLSTFHDLDINGEVHCNRITTPAGKGFKIDHPLDPENKHLYHWCVESPDVMNIYNGNVTTDVDGKATVVLPDYFEALNGDFRYQLTVIGKAALATIENEIEDNTFTIRTDKPNVKVSWQVMGTRHDPAIGASRLPVEEEKPAPERGFVAYPKSWEATEDSIVNPQGCKEIVSTEGRREQEPAVACS